MRLFHSPTSPYVRKVMVLLHESGLLDQVELVTGSGTPLDPGAAPLDANPLGKVPALEREDGPALFDSRVICRYLDDRAKAGLYPTGAALWDTLVLEAAADGILDAALLMVYESRLRPEPLSFASFFTLVFSAKEALYKALSSRLDRVPDFRDATLTALQPGQMALTLDGQSHVVRFRLSNRDCVTLVAVSAP